MKIHFFTMSSKGDFEDFIRPLRGAQNRSMSTWWILEALKGAHENPLLHYELGEAILKILWDLWEQLKIDLWALDGFRGFHETFERSSKSTYEHLMDFRGSRRGSWKSTFSPWARRGDFEDFMRPLRGAKNRPLSTWWILRIRRGSWKSTFSLWARTGDFENFMRPLRGAQNRPMSTWWILEAFKGAHENPFFHHELERRFWGFHQTSERSSKSIYEHLMDFRGSQRGSWKSTSSLWAWRGDFEDFMRPLRAAQNRPLSTWWISRISWDLWEELKIDLWALDGF